MAIVDTVKIDPSVVVKIRNSAGGNSLEYIDAGILYNNDLAPVTTINNLIDDCVALEAAITDLNADAVLLTGPQSVGGVKTFTDGIAFSALKGVTDASLTIGVGLAAGDRSFRVSRDTDGDPYAALLWVESSALWKFTTNGSTLAKLQGAAPTVGDDYVTKTYADGLVVTAQGIFQQTTPVTTNNALRVDTTDTDNPVWWRGDGTNQRPITGIQQATSQPSGLATGNMWIDKTNTARPEPKWYNGTTSKDLQAGVMTSKKVTLTDGATPALDASLGNLFVLVAAGNRTIAVPSSPSVGQKIIIKHTASGGARTLALNTGAGGFRYGTDITGLTATDSGKTDYIGAIWNDVDSFWDVVAYIKGY